MTRLHIPIQHSLSKTVFSLSALLAITITIFAQTAVAAATTSSNDTLQDYNNWSGYAASGHIFNKVHGDFVVPTVTCTAANAETLFWVGFDSSITANPNTQNLEQDGFGAKCSAGANPKVSYFAWWQMFPATSFHKINTSKLSVKAGNKIAASVTYDTANGKFEMSLANKSTDRKYETTQACVQGYNCTRGVAVWIAERYDISNSVAYSPLAEWNTDRNLFTDDTAAKSNSPTVLRPISAYNYTAIDMLDFNDFNSLATVSELKSGGTSFIDTWHAAQ